MDTNVTWDVRALRDLCKLAQKKGVKVVVHTQVYLERRRQQRVHLGKRFKEVIFDGFLDQQGIQVIDLCLDQSAAARWADDLAQRYPTIDAWELAKQRTLGGELRAEFKAEPGKMPMTMDWLIAFAVESEAESRIITKDTREEWRLLRDSEPRRALGWEEAVAWLNGLPEVEPPLEEPT